MGTPFRPLGWVDRAPRESAKRFFVLENLMVASRLLIGWLFPSRPTYVEALVQKHRIIGQKHLDCVETSLDVQPFVDPSATSARKVVITDRDEDQDDEDDDI